MLCPQCNTDLAQGAKGCAACGWKSSKKTLWIVLGCVAGFFVLLCCGIGTFFVLKVRKVAQSMQGEIVPIQLSVLHAQVVNYARIHGKAPATLEEAADAPLEGKNGEKVNIRFQSGQKTADMWGHEFRYAPAADRTFEIRSAGPDGKFDTPDDLSEKGSLDDDLNALQKDVEQRGKQMGQTFLKEFGVDPAKLEEKGGEGDAGKPKADGGDAGKDAGKDSGKDAGGGK